MPRDITDALKLVRDFHKKDALAQTNQIKYGCFLCMAQKTLKKLFPQDLKLEAKNAGMLL